MAAARIFASAVLTQKIAQVILVFFTAAHFTHPKFSGSSYMLFNNTRRSGKNFRVSIELKADDLNGVILFVGDPKNVSVDFFAVVLIDGFIQIRY